MLPHTTVDTRTVPALDRFDLWLSTVAGCSAPMRIRTDHHEDFTARSTLTDLGPLYLARHRYLSLEALPPRRGAPDDAPGCYLLALTVEGGSWCSQRGQASSLTPGEFTFYDTARPVHLRHHNEGRRPAGVVTAIVPYAAVPLPRKRLAALYGGRMSGTEGVGLLLAQLLRQVAEHPGQYHPADAPRLGSVGLDLISTLLGRHLVVEEELPREVRRRALLTQVQGHIQRHLGDPGLSPQTIADAHHLSVRSLHRLFEAEQTTVTGHVRSLRLAGCRRDLADPALRHHSIASIAARWGFVSQPHFSRLFRAAHQVTPQQWRDRHR